MGDSDSVQLALFSLLLGWDFLALDARGRSGGLATGWQKISYRVSNSWGCSSCLGVDIFSREHNNSFDLINIYGSYLDRAVLWENLFTKPFLSQGRRIIGGDLNFTLGASEVWGPSTNSNPLAEFFRSHLS